MELVEKKSDEILDQFYKIYNNDRGNLKKLSPVLKGMGLSYMDMILLVKQEFGLSMGDIISLLEIPDVVV